MTPYAKVSLEREANSNNFKPRQHLISLKKLLPIATGGSPVRGLSYPTGFAPQGGRSL